MPLRGEMPIVLTLPLHIERRPRAARRRRTRRIVLFALVAVAAALLTVGV
jgi:hypothetical protein